MWIEILLGILLPLILESIFIFFENNFSQRKENKYQKKFKASLEIDNTNKVTMLIKPETKSLLLIGICGFGFMWFCGVISIICLIFVENIKAYECFIAVLIFSVICLPIISIFLHYVTKKVEFNDDFIILKSIFLKRKIYVLDISSVYEEIYKQSKKLRFTTSNLIVITSKYSTIKVSQNYGNYELLKNKFL